jgi:thymidylate synthase
MKNVHDEQLKALYEKILVEGVRKEDRTGVGIKSIFGHQMRFKMSEGFPLLTLRKIHLKSLIHELLWFLGAYEEKYQKFGNTNIRYLLDHGVSFWNEWPYERYKAETLKKYHYNDLKDEKTIKKLRLLSLKDFAKKIQQDDWFAKKWGDLGPVYGKQWLDWGGYQERVEIKKEFSQTKGDFRVIDHQGWKDIPIRGVNQIKNVLTELRENPDSRRIIVNAWNVSDLEEMLLVPCHMFFQFYTTPQEEGPRKLSLQLYQRSCDSYLGLPFNIASYAILLHMIAQVVGMVPDELIWTGGDVHLYNNSLKATQELLKRKPFTSPQLKLSSEIEDLFEFRYEDITLVNYQSHENIKVSVAV